MTVSSKEGNCISTALYNIMYAGARAGTLSGSDATLTAQLIYRQHDCGANFAFMNWQSPGQRHWLNTLLYLEDLVGGQLTF